MSLDFSLTSFFFIERPFRDKLRVSAKKMLIILSSFFIFIFLISWYFTKTDDFYQKLNPIIKNTIEKNPYKLTQEGKLCHERRTNTCNFKSPNAKNDIILIGDSVAARLSENGLKEELNNKNFNYLPSTYGGCNFHIGFNLVNKRNFSKRGCRSEFQTERLKLINNRNNSIIILAGNYPHDFEESFFDNEEGGDTRTPYDLVFQPINKIIFQKSERVNLLKEGFKNNLYEILEKGNKVILVYPIPEIGLSVSRKLFINDLIDQSFKNISISHAVFINRTLKTYKLFDSIKHKNLYRVYPEKIFCNSMIKERCVVYFDNISYFSDVVHPSSQGARLINNLIINEIEYMDKK